MKKIEKLPDIVYPKGTGIRGLSARLIKREGRICMYERSDMVWEVFKVKIHKESTLKGISYSAHEIYPGNEDFGDSAWCFSSLENAEARFNHMVKYESIGGPKTRGRSMAGDEQETLSIAV